MTAAWATLAVDAPLGDDALAALFRAAWPGHGTQGLGAVLERSLCWVSAHRGGELVGFVYVAWDGGAHGFLLDPTVHPDHRRRGIGVALVQRATEEVRRRGIEWLSVDFEAHLAGFYRRCGFRRSAAGVIHLNPPELPVPGSVRIQVRPFEPRWQERCRALMAGLPEWFGIASATAAYLAHLAQRPSWVATSLIGSDAELMGLMTLVEPQRGAFELDLLAVAREHHRTGVGRALVAHAEQWALERQGRIMLVKTLGESNPDAFYARTRAFYLALGYQPLFETERLWDARNPALILVKPLV